MKDEGEPKENDVMEGKDVAEVPLVFISYSHDSDEHGAWVLKLAERLRQCGVDVILDQWDLGPGDDLPKFMEKGVSEADRVLMVCTEAYVRKADEGKGGVGYEAMIVTGELVKDLGTNKFIPIVRQGRETAVVPKSVSTRFYVNFSAGQDQDKALEALVREIHETPKARKPAVGRNPYTTGDASVSAAVVTEVKIEDAGSAYVIASSTARSGDFTEWRQLVRRVKEPLSGRLNAWRKRYAGAHSIEIAKLPELVLGAATIYSPLMAVALAGVESGNPKFNNQQAMLDEFLRPKDWNAAGLTVIGSLPEALVYTYQALHGATCLEVGELGLAIALTRARVAPAHRYEGVIVHEEHQFMGWPESFNHTCTMAWQYLVSLADKWPWLGLIFESADGYRAALSAYYMGLSIQHLALLLAAGNGHALENKDLRFDIPVVWMRMPLEVQQKAYRLLLSSHDQVRRVWRSLGVQDNTMSAAWPQWMEHTLRWMANIDHYGWGHGKPVHSVLFEDLRPEEG